MSNKKDLEYLQNQLGVRDSMILNRLIDNHLEKIYRLQQRINKAIDFINAWKDNETDLKVSMLDLLQIEDILRGKDNETN